mmetsp:Transcript_3117/g.4396  ORF Transcript_3117/g.4396 Transcript_3117/m.4396 type:complete len:737 (+) Transcript_3117:99-2309(+)
MIRGNLVTVATCNLNQWALDFDGNLERIWKSCQEAREAGARYRLGPELEICGYGCEDHFLEADTFQHCWESLAELIERGATDDGMLCDFGMPVLHCGARYNCRVLCANRKILLIRPKTAMADNGNYREGRYFTAYRIPDNGESNGKNEPHLLPHYWKKKFGQDMAPFGIAFLQCGGGVGAKVGFESCEELWTPRSAHIDMALAGVEIIGNGSGSHHELRKLKTRLELIVSATRKCGGVYLYANQRGCDGGRLYYDGCAMIVCNGMVLAQAKQFDVRDVQTIIATIDLDDVRSYRASIPSFGIQASLARQEGNKISNFIYCNHLDLGTVQNEKCVWPKLSQEISLHIHTPEEECCLGPACWLWDFLRRSGAAGFFLPLSGGADSSAVATIVGSMCQIVTKAAKDNPDGEVASECRRVCNKNKPDDDPSWVPSNPQDMANYVLHTVFMGTENSSLATERRAKHLGEIIGSYHLSIKIDIIVIAILKVFSMATGRSPQFTSHGGGISEDLALQNIQARLRMVTAYLFAQLLPWVRSRSGFLLVLGSANVDEGLRGYMTKYDCSSADLNPIGAISKHDLKQMLLWAGKEYKYTVLEEIVRAPPTAELRPITNTGKGEEIVEHTQTDEEDMGMTYDELGYFGRLRKISRCGPVSMFRKLCLTWNHLLPSEVAVKVKRFFYYYAVNRHKMCTVTPAYHAEAYSPDDNRFDLRQFLYNTKWTRQFSVIDKMVDDNNGECETGN